MWAAIAFSVPGHFDVQCFATFFLFEQALLFSSIVMIVLLKRSFVEKLLGYGLLTPPHLTKLPTSHITHITFITYITHIIHITRDTSPTSLISLTSLTLHMTHHSHLSHLTSHLTSLTSHITDITLISHITHISHHTSLTSTHVTHRISPHHSHHIRHLNFGELARARNVGFTNTNCQTATPKRLGSFVLAGSVTLVSKAARFGYPVFTVW